MKKNFTKNNAVWSLFLMLFVMASCNKDTGLERFDGIKMRVSLSGVVKSDDLRIRQKSSASGHTATLSDGIQTRVISLGDDYSVMAELIPEQESTAMRTKQSTDNGLKAAATEVRNDLPAGTKYRLLVYDADGLEVHRQDREVGVNPTEFEEFELAAEGVYTFAAYSAGTDDIPALAGTDLSDFYMVVTENQEKFMHFVQTMNVVYGINNLDVVLVNKLTEITTVIDATNIGANSLKGIFQPRFEAATHSTGVSNRATVKLLDGSMTYPGTAEDKVIVFPAIGAGGTTVATSEPTVMVHDVTTTGRLRMAYITIEGPNGPINKEISFDDIVIDPGMKYELRLRLNKGRCMIDVDKEYFEMGPQSGSSGSISENFTFSADANGGVVLDIVLLDNSFNMVINGTPLANDEIDFQDDSPFVGPGYARRTARFTDGTFHGAGGIQEIWELSGSETAPLIRLSISPEGVVTMEGSKTSGGQLFPMELFGHVNGNTSNPLVAFNNIIWNSDGTENVVIVNQMLVGATEMKAYVGGKQIVDCETGLPVNL